MNFTQEVIGGSLPFIPRHKRSTWTSSTGRTKEDPCRSSPSWPRAQARSTHTPWTPSNSTSEQTRLTWLCLPQWRPSNLHTANHYPPWVWHKLPRSNIEVVQEFHDEWMDEEPKATLKSSFIEHTSLGEKWHAFSLSRGILILTSLETRICL